MIIFVSLYFKYNSLGINSGGNSDLEENTGITKVIKSVEEVMFDQFTASFCNESPQKALTARLVEMHKNPNLLEILDLVQDYEADEVMLYQKLFIDRKKPTGCNV